MVYGVVGHGIGVSYTFGMCDCMIVVCESECKFENVWGFCVLVVVILVLPGEGEGEVAIVSAYLRILCEVMGNGIG